MRWVPYGPQALMFYFADQVGEEAFSRGRAIAARLETSPPEGVEGFVCGFTSVLLEFDREQVPDPKGRVFEWIAFLKSALAAPLLAAPLKSIPVTYDGPDLSRVAEHARLSVDQVVEIHSRTVYKVYLLGFAPGFPYLGDLDPRLHTPRLASPRPRVPAGSIGIGGEHTGIYPLDTPGGWNLIGRTPRILFDPTRATVSGRGEDAFLLRPGDRVQFVPNMISS